MEKASSLQSNGSGNTVLLMQLQGGTRGVFKLARGEKGGVRKGVPPGGGWRREIAASRVADVLGMGDLVPPTTVRDQAGDLGSMQEYVPDAPTAFDSHEPFDGPVDAARAAVLDYVLGHLDRHRGNWLVRDGKLRLIDNGLSLPTAYHENDFFNMGFWENAQREDLEMPADVDAWSDRWPRVEQALRDSGIEDDAIALTKQRFDAVVSGEHLYVQSLPSLLPPTPGDLGPTLGDMAQYYSRAARAARVLHAARAARAARDLRR